MVQYFPIVTGSLTVTGSVNVSGSITTNSTITATTLVVQTITSSISAITGSTNFGSLSTNTHTFTGSINASGSANFSGSLIVNGAATLGTGTSSYTFGGGSAVAGGLTDKDLTLKAWSPTSGTNEYAGDLILQSGVGTGNASGKLGSVVIKAGIDGATNSTLGTYSTVATFTKTGLGIGTSSPMAPLNIAYPATGSAISATNTQQAYDYSRFRIKHYTDSNLGLSIGYAGANYTYIQACYNEGTSAPLFLNPFGANVSIGNYTDAGFRLYVKGTNGLYVEGGTSSSNSALLVNNNAGDTQYFRIRGDGYMASTPTYNNTYGNAANMYIGADGFMGRSTSSRKYKTDIQNYSKGLAEVLQLRPVSYKSKNPNEDGLIFAGLIAEEIHDLGLTEFVQYAEDGTPDALAYQNMVALLTKAIQELTARVQELENK